MLKPSFSNSFKRPAWDKYFSATLDPGDRDVFIYGLIVSPSSLAFLAISPAAINTPGFEVLVQDVIELITTAPWSILYYFP